MTSPLHHIGKACMALALLFGYSMCLAQHFPRTEFNFRNDNDLYLFNKQDQYYTNGVFFNIRKAADSAKLSINEANRIWGLTVGQKMYNAYTANIRHIEEVDRPITAYLFFAANFDRYFESERFMSVTVEAGTIGQRALGKEFQESFHKAFRLYDIAGWQYQLKNAFGIDAAVHYGGLFYRNPARWFDMSWRATATLGLNHTGLSASPSFRFGRINPLHRSVYTSSRLQARGHTMAKELFLYYSPRLHFVGYDATLQGGMFLHDKGPVTYTPARWVWYNQVGVMYAKNALSLHFQYIFYTKEVPGMFFRHRYGSVGVGYRF
ncbi:lipid A deacylase LpxR family protein [Parapedobacter sp. 10938]|uniref:lipid A deacylase LpxR family protein n=1 Tax=Parapedobacter flavus TaxID=3110225 RepID=UPI002DB75220|nr:lipid A deacylase LpxR family protein [Parapedobacter sp. 10938]MEC3878266.1 lipid A deacylase LpxR family protein [Parapedobacter sp. 10938]